MFLHLKEMYKCHITSLPLWLIALMRICISCEKELTAPTINQGVYGVIMERYGDFMPGASSEHGERYVRREIYVYEYTLPSQMTFTTPYWNAWEVTPETMPTRLIAKTKSSKNGFYQIQLPAGKYSIFVLDRGMLNYSRGYMGMENDGGMNPITINPGEVREYNYMLHNEVY